MEISVDQETWLMAKMFKSVCTLFLDIIYYIKSNMTTVLGNLDKVISALWNKSKDFWGFND